MWIDKRCATAKQIDIKFWPALTADPGLTKWKKYGLSQNKSLKYSKYLKEYLKLKFTFQKYRIFNILEISSVRSVPIVIFISMYYYYYMYYYYIYTLDQYIYILLFLLLFTKTYLSTYLPYLSACMPTDMADMTICQMKWNEMQMKWTQMKWPSVFLNNLVFGFCSLC